MKIVNILRLIVFLSLFSSFAQAAEVKFPTLSELAAKKAAQSLEIGNPAYESLIPELKGKILIQKGTLQQVLNFVDQYHDYVTQDLIESIPDKFWHEFVNGNITIQQFIEQLELLSSVEKDWLIDALKEKILHKDKISIAFFHMELRRWFGIEQHFWQKQLPIEYEWWHDETDDISRARFNYPIFNSLDYLCVFFLGQKLQQLFLQSLEYQKDKVILDEEKIEESQLRLLLNELLKFTQKHIQTYVFIDEYKTAEEYVSKIIETIDYLLYNKILAVKYIDYIIPKSYQFEAQ